METLLWDSLIPPLELSSETLLGNLKKTTGAAQLELNLVKFCELQTQIDGVAFETQLLAQMARNRAEAERKEVARRDPAASKAKAAKKRKATKAASAK